MPCAKIIEILKPFEPITFIHNEHKVSTLSILELLLLKMNYSSTISISVDNPLPKNILKDLENIFKNT